MSDDAYATTVWTPFKVEPTTMGVLVHGTAPLCKWQPNPTPHSNDSPMIQMWPRGDIPLRIAYLGRV